MQRGRKEFFQRASFISEEGGERKGLGFMRGGEDLKRDLLAKREKKEKTSRGRRELLLRHIWSAFAIGTKKGTQGTLHPAVRKTSSLAKA